MTWPTVIAIDNSGVVPTVTESGVKSIFYRGRHLVSYNATDEAGNDKTCKFFVTVEGKTKMLMTLFFEVCLSLVGGNCIKVLWLFSLNIVLKCQTLTPPVNGFIDGTCDNSYGSTCSIHCNDGYNLLGAENLTCEARSGQITGYWDNAVPVCKGNETRSLSSREKAIAGATKIVCLVLKFPYFDVA